MIFDEKINIILPNSCIKEEEWVINVVFNDFLGLNIDVSATPSATGRFLIQLNNKVLDLNNVFFAQACQAWLKPASLPDLPLAQWDHKQSALTCSLLQKPLPILFGKADMVVEDERISLEIDIFGSIFFMLSRYEEAIFAVQDNYGRYPAKATIAAQADFLDRPIVNEYLEVLWAAMKQLWPKLERRKQVFTREISCDVDVPYSAAIQSWMRTLKQMGKDLIQQKSPSRASRSLINKFLSARGAYHFDPNHTFEWIMDSNEAVGNTVCFYFIVAHSSQTFDGHYTIHEPRIRSLLKQIHKRGHKIGLHSSYNSYLDAEQIQKEVTCLRQVMEIEKISQTQLGVRQHYLRWRTPDTARHQDAAKLDYDSTLAFAEQPGFRCGTCFSYPMYDLGERRALSLYQRPLILMECSVIAERYLNLGYSEQALEKMLAYKAICQHYQGNFSLLWHNSHFLHADDARFYLQLIA